MEQSKDGMMIYQLLPKLMDRIGAISKDRKNPVGFRYRGIEDALNHLQPGLIEFGLSLEIQCRELKSETLVEKGDKKDRFVFHTTLLMDVVFIAPDGSRSLRTGAGEGLDIAGDKATNKAMAAAFKYAIFFGLCVPVEDDALDDPDTSGKKQPSEPTAPVTPVLPSLPPVAGVPDAGPRANEGICSEILRLVQSLEMPMEVVQAMLAKHGAAKISELSIVAGDVVLGKLKQMDLEQQAVATFSKG